MSIESKAKTQIDVANICDDCMSNCGSCPYSKKWVSLEDAQKEITENKTEFERNNAFTHKRILELEGVIEAANKILARYKNGEIPWYATYTQIEAALLIPRSQDQKIVDDLKHVSSGTAKRMIAGKDKVLTVFKENTTP